MGMVGSGGGGFGFEGGFRDFVGHGIDEADGGGVYAGSGADAGKNLLDEDDGLIGSGETELGEIETKGEEVVRVEAEVQVDELEKLRRAREAPMRRMAAKAISATTRD